MKQRAQESARASQPLCLSPRAGADGLLLCKGGAKAGCSGGGGVNWRVTVLVTTLELPARSGGGATFTWANINDAGQTIPMRHDSAVAAPPPPFSTGLYPPSWPPPPSPLTSHVPLVQDNCLPLLVLQLGLGADGTHSALEALIQQRSLYAGGHAWVGGYWRFLSWFS